MVTGTHPVHFLVGTRKLGIVFQTQIVIFSRYLHTMIMTVTGGLLSCMSLLCTGDEALCLAHVTSDWWLLASSENLDNIPCLGTH